MTATATVAARRMESAALTRAADAESREWLRSLRATGAAREDALARLHGLLLRGARFEVARRRPMLPHLRGNELDEIASSARTSGASRLRSARRPARSASSPRACVRATRTR